MPDHRGVSSTLPARGAWRSATLSQGVGCLLLALLCLASHGAGASDTSPMLRDESLLPLAMSNPPVGMGEDDGNPIVLGMSAAITGPSRGLGIELYRGAMAYFQLLNAEGGVDGRPVRIDIRDDGYNPDPAVTNTIEFMRSEDVLALFGYVGTPTTNRILPLLESYGQDSPQLFFPFTGALSLRIEPYVGRVFNLRPSYHDETMGLVNKFYSIGRTRISVFHQSDAYGRSGWDGVRAALARLDLQIASEATYHRGAGFDEDMSRQVDIIMEGYPDAVICVGAYAACAAFIRDARNKGLDVPIANLSFVGSESMLRLLLEEEGRTGRSYTHDLVNSQVVPSYEEMFLPAVREYRMLMDTLDPPPPPGADLSGYETLPYSFVSFEGYFNARVMAHILERAEELTPQGIVRAAENVNDLSIGTDSFVSFRDGKRQGMERIYFTTVRNGRFVSLYSWMRWAK